MLLPGDTGQSYTATANGNYAAIVNNGSCIDTTGCVQVSTVFVASHASMAAHISLYPQPAAGLLNINLGNLGVASLQLFSAHGQLVHTANNVQVPVHQLQLQLPAGFYTLRVHAQHQVLHLPVVWQ